MNGKLRLLSAALLIALAPVVHAQTAGEVDTQVSSLSTTTANAGQTRVATRIASSFSSLAGSQDNALALVNALRNGTPVTLSAPDDGSTSGSGTTGGTGTTTGGTGTTTGGTGTATGGSGTTTGSTGTGGTGTTTGSTGTTITPPTGKMGWGEVFISLALAKAELANLGITHPTPDQLNAALTGGDITGTDGSTTTVKGVLEMRADGMGWGQIAQAEGTKLGPVVSSLKSAHARMASLSTSGTTSTTSPTTSKSLTTASGSVASSHRGIVTAGGSSSSSTLSGKGHKGIVTATGSSSTIVGRGHASRGITTASGVAAGSGSHGLMTASGSSTSAITAAGAASSGHGASAAGLVTATGGGASSGITTAEGGGNNGLHHGHGKGGG